MRQHENEAVVRSFFAAFKTAAYERQVREFLVDDVKWHVTGTNPLAGDFVGIDAVVGAMRRYGEYSHHSLELDTQSLFADADHAVAIHRATGRRDGIGYEAHEIDVFHLSGGLITEFWSFSEDQNATDAFWS